VSEFSGKIVSAFFADEERNMVKIRWDDNGTLNVYHVPVDDNNADYQELLNEGWDIDRLIDETAEAKRGESRAFSELVNDAARSIIEEMQAESVEAAKIALATAKAEADAANARPVNTEKIEGAFDFMIKSEDPDILFKFKLWALETDIVENATKEQKSKLRKAKSILEGFAILHEMK
jgi:hypothetical protein